MGSVRSTLGTIWFSVVGTDRGGRVPVYSGSEGEPEEGDLSGGVGRLLSQEGELRLFFPAVLSLAAPFILFRLKREGYSNCRVEATRGGLVLTGRR